jgi:RNA polymerase subunit RPABC4/transcription elongation factor Spt4
VINVTDIEYIATFKLNTKIGKYAKILSDKKFHCRNCSQAKTGSRQIAGGGGIQRLQDGTKSRPGIEIITEKRLCTICKDSSEWDRWTGEFILANPASSIPEKLQARVKKYYSYVDAIELRKRKDFELVVDHRFPKIRRGGMIVADTVKTTDEEIQAKYQLLKKDSIGNHNKLKTEACKACFKTGKRGNPLGISFYYKGDDKWSEDYPKTGKNAESGCVGCGWYDFAAWRKALNTALCKPSAVI